MALEILENSRPFVSVCVCVFVSLFVCLYLYLTLRYRQIRCSISSLIPSVLSDMNQICIAIRYDTIRYGRFTCAQKLTNGQRTAQKRKITKK